MPRPITALVSLSCAAAALITAADARAEEEAAGPIPVELVGLRFGAATPADLARLAEERNLWCKETLDVGGLTTVRCPGTVAPSPVPADATFWFRRGVLSGATEVARIESAQFTKWSSSFARLEERVTAALGPPDVSPPPPPPWFTTLDGFTQLRAVAAGRVHLASEWRRDDARASVRLEGRGGRAVLVLRVAVGAPPPTALVASAAKAPIAEGPAPNAGCDDAHVAAAVMSVFSMTEPPEERAASAGVLRHCRVKASSGALAAVVANDPSPAVRLEAVRGLGVNGGPEAKAALDRVFGANESPALRREAVRSLARLGQTDLLHGVMRDDRQPLEVRGEALVALEDSPEPPNQDDLRALSDGNGDRAFARELQAALGRRAAARAITAERASRPVRPAPPAAPVQRAPPATTAASERAVTETDAAADLATPVRASGGEMPTPPRTLALRPDRLRAAPVVVMRPPPPPEPPPPPFVDGPGKGLPLAITTSAISGGALFPFMAMMADSRSTPTLLAAGTGGAIIGAGTTFGLSRFGMRPTLGQAAWFTNTTAWGTLAGLTTAQGLGFESHAQPKPFFATVIIGQGLGMAGGVWTARRYTWTAPQMVFADSLLIAGGVAALGTQRLGSDDKPHVTPLLAAVTTPWMIGSAVAARAIDPTARDLHLMAAATLAGGWTGALLGGGLVGDGLASHQAEGGGEIGLGAGYVGTAVAAAFSDVSPRRSWVSGMGLLAGNAIGFGAGMIATPEPGNAPTWTAAAGAGGAAAATATFLYYPYAHLGRRAPEMAIHGAVSAPLVWYLASRAASTGVVTDTKRNFVTGGLVAGSVGGGVAGIVASRGFDPTPADHLLDSAATIAGTGAGLGIARLATPDRGPGSADFFGALGGSAAGFAAGAVAAHSVKLRGRDWAAGGVGAGYGALAGVLVPSLGGDVWRDDRGTSGGFHAGWSLGAAAATVAARATDSRPGQIALPSIAGGFGLAAGTGLGLMLPDDTTQPERVGAVAGSLGAIGASIATDRWLHLSYGLGESAASMGLVGAGLGTSYGLLLAAAVDAPLRPGSVEATPGRQLGGGMLLGASAASASGLVLSRFFQPTPRDLFVAPAASGVGFAIGRGAGLLVGDERTTTWSALGGALGGLGAGAFITHRTTITNPALAAGGIALPFGALIGTLAPSLDSPAWGGGRPSEGGAWLGAGTLAASSTAFAQAIDATPGQVTVAGSAALLGLGSGTGLGMMIARDGDSRPVRIGAVAGSAGLGVASIALERKLRLADGLGRSAEGFAALGATLATGEGFLLAGAASDGGRVSDASTTAKQGAALWGVSTGVASGLVLSKLFDLDAPEAGVAGLGWLLGAGAGRGVSLLATAESGRPDTLATIGGSLAGLAGATVVENVSPLDGRDAMALPLGLGFGAVIGALGPTLADPVYPGLDRRGEGGLLLGGSLTGAGAIAFRHVTDATPGQIGVAGTASALGLGAGTGLGMMIARDGDSRPIRIGTVAGTAGVGVASIALERRLRLADGLGPSAPGFAALGATLATGEGFLLAGAASDGGRVSDASGTALEGGALWGVSTGVASGLVLSKFFDLDTPEAGVAGLGWLLGAGAGRGVSLLATAESGRPDTLATIGGSLVGLAGAAVVENVSPLDQNDAFALPVGLGFGAVIGALAPTLAEPAFPGFDRRGEGGLLVGATVTGAGAIAFRHLTDATPGQIGVAATASMLGLGSGTGLGMMLAREGDSRPIRIGTVAGTAGLGVASIALERRLRLAEGLGPSATGFAALGAALGTSEGLLLAGAASDGGRVSDSSNTARLGAAIWGTSTGIASGLVLSKFFDLDAPEAEVAGLGWLLGAGAGRGAALLVTSEPGRPDTLATIGGSLAGLAGAAVVENVSPLDEVDATALPVGLGFGSLVGALAPSLSQPTFGGFDRRGEGGLLFGGSAGGLAAVALRHATGAAPRSVGLAALAGGLGGTTGVGMGLLAEPDGSQATRIGIAAGSVAGLGIGAGIWPRLDFGPGDVAFIAGASGAAGWAGLWAPLLGHAAIDDTQQNRMTGGVLAGAGGASIFASLLTPAVEVDEDLVENALWFDALLSGAGAGAGAFASPRSDAIAWGVLGGGTAGLVAGAALHRSIEMGDEDTPLVALAGIEGVWLGAWLPNLVYRSDEITTRERAGALLAGAIGPASVAALVSGHLEISPRTAALSGLGSVLGASIAGGFALASEPLHDQRGVGLLLGGSTIGMLGGGLLAPELEFGRHGLGSAAIGGMLGASEALVFAWAGGAQAGDEYGGAALAGAGLGTTLGLAAAAYPHFTANEGWAATGFGAWGGWIGSFTGAMSERSPGRVTLGGLAGADAGVVGGLVLLRTGVVEPRDFGWLSLGGALGTVAGGLGGAVFSTKERYEPLLGGLAVGPLVGMAAAGIMLPKLRASGGPDPTAAFFPASRSAGWSLSTRHAAVAPASERAADRVLTSADLLLSAERNGGDTAPGLGRRVLSLFEVAQWMPLVGTLPPAPDAPGPAPFLVGVTGLLK